MYVEAPMMAENVWVYKGRCLNSNFLVRAHNSLLALRCLFWGCNYLFGLFYPTETKCNTKPITKVKCQHNSGNS